MSNMGIITMEGITTITQLLMEVSTRAWYLITVCILKIRIICHRRWRKRQTVTQEVIYTRLRVLIGVISIFLNFQALRPAPAFMLHLRNHHEAIILRDQAASVNSNPASIKARVLMARPSLSSCFLTTPTVQRVDLSCHPKTSCLIHTTRQRTRHQNRIAMATLSIKVLSKKKALYCPPLKTTRLRAHQLPIRHHPQITRAIHPWI